MADAFQETARAVKNARTFSEVFGAAAPGDKISQKSRLRKQFGYLAKIVHPDLVPSHYAAEAKALFELLNKLRHAAEEAIMQSKYDQPFAATLAFSEADDGSELVSPNGAYRLKADPFTSGDFSEIYRGRTITKTPELIMAKIANDPTANTWLEREAAILATVAAAKAGSSISGIKRFLPNMIDTFLVAGDSSTRYRTNVTSWVPDMVSITEVMKAYLNGLDPAEAWPSRRIIAQTCAARMLGVVHGAIVPDHVLVDPYKHEPLHIGWAHAVKSGEKLTQVIDRWRDCYAPEVFAKQPVDHRTDIYMAGATITRLLGGDVKKKYLPAAVPKEMAALILRCLEDSPLSRPQDGFELLNEFTRVIRKIWGRNYRVLTMPHS